MAHTNNLAMVLCEQMSDKRLKQQHIWEFINKS